MINKAKKVTAAPRYKKADMKFSDIDGAGSGRALFFPTVTVKKQDGNDYRFIVFNRKKFLNRYVELKKGRQ